MNNVCVRERTISQRYSFQMIKGYRPQDSQEIKTSRKNIEKFLSLRLRGRGQVVAEHPVISISRPTLHRTNNPGCRGRHARWCNPLNDHGLGSIVTINGSFPEPGAQEDSNPDAIETSQHRKCMLQI
ncbi:hypothetical protein J6590_039532 [Homalodisca vitripennis]|nr:hypothetical protein J6590_039532 [Homalodisca vitripennis]